jgi:hypothetical protein
MDCQQAKAKLWRKSTELSVPLQVQARRSLPNSVFRFGFQRINRQLYLLSRLTTARASCSL